MSKPKVKKNEYGYQLNINKPPYDDLYSRYKQYKGIPKWCPCSDRERAEFEEFVMNAERKKEQKDE